jgi:hypothetical protein
MLFQWSKQLKTFMASLGAFSIAFFFLPMLKGFILDVLFFSGYILTDNRSIKKVWFDLGPVWDSSRSTKTDLDSPFLFLNAFRSSNSTVD